VIGPLSKNLRATLYQRRCGLSRRELRARAAAIAEGNWASEAVRKAIEEMMAAVIAAITAATIAATAGSRR